jgi:P2 family phage contractile tail tube protein
MSAANRVLRNFAVFVDGNGYAGNAEEVTLPTLDIKFEEFMAGGLDSPLPIDMGQEKMELKFKLNDLGADALSTWGVIGGADFTYNFKGALQNLDGSTESILVACRGHTKTLTPSTWTAGSKANHEYAVFCTYYRYDVDGSTVHEIDVANMIRSINGVDQLANVRTALGM